MQELEEIVNNPNFFIDEDSPSLDIVILPPEPDYVTDEDEAEDNELGIVEVRDVPGQLEVQFSNEDQDIEDTAEVQSTSAISVQTGTKKQRLSNSLPKWKKCDSKYTFTDADFAALEKDKIEALVKEHGALTPLQLFEKFLSNDMLEYIKEETLRYSQRVKNDTSFTLDIDELKCFIGILLFSGYHQVPSERMYWSTDADLGVPIVQAGMSRTRYAKIKSMLHFADNDKLDKVDRAYKLRPLIEKMNEKFQQFGIFTSYLSVDEMIVKYYGHHGLKQFIRGKPIRFGYKLWALCASNGYCYKFVFYTGKETSKQPGLTLGSRVVTELLSCVPTPYEHAVFFDNFFTNRDLLVHLKNIGFRATGTVRDNRTDKCPMKSAKELAKESRGSFDYRYDTMSEVLMVRWNDNKCVIVATNYDKIEPLAKATRWKREAKQRVEVPQPKLIQNYNKYMGGVDHHDWLVGKYGIQIRGKNGTGLCLFAFWIWH